MDLLNLFKICLEKDASDLHLSTGIIPMLRIDGMLIPLDHQVISKSDIYDALKIIMTEHQLEKFKMELEYDFSTYLPEISLRFRANAFFQNRGPAIAFRLIPENIKTLSQLKSPGVLKNIIQQQHGLVIVTGPTGSGKSTTLAAMIHEINQTQRGHILSIEDPIEFIHQPNKCLINQREVSRDTLSFNNALRSGLREDPDYILIGEMRDTDTIRLALTAAETGHLVFATLHTSSAAKAVDRIISVFSGDEQPIIRSMMSESLQAVIAQRLILRKGGGRVAAYEILIANNAIANLIRENKIQQISNVLHTSKNQGMQTLQQSLNQLLHANEIEYEELKRQTNKISPS